MTDLALMPAACYPVYPGDRRAQPLAPRRGVRRRRRRLGVPPRALPRPGAAPDVPPARARAPRPARDGRRLARRVGPSAACRCCAPSASTPSSTSPRTRSSAAAGACWPPASASSRSSSRSWSRSPGQEPTAVASFNQHRDHFTAAYGITLQGGRGPQRLPGLRARAHRACAAAHARPGPGALADGGARRRCGCRERHRAAGARRAGACSDRPGSGRLSPPPAARRRPQLPRDQLLHRHPDRARSTPAATSRWPMFGHLVRIDFEGDQWTFFKPPAGGPRAPLRGRHPRDAALPAAARSRSPSSWTAGGR